MALTTKGAGALVAGTLQNTKGVNEMATANENVKIKVLRPFYIQGVVQDKDKIITVSKIFGAEMVGANKAEYAKETAASAEPAADKQPPKGKGKDDAK